MKFVLCVDGCIEYVYYDIYVYFYCDDCGKMYCIDELEVFKVKVLSGFKVNLIYFVMNGVCDSCWD